MRNNSNTTTEPPMLFGVGEAASTLAIGRSSVYALIKSGKLRSIKVGERRLIPRTALEEFIEKLEAS